MAYLIFLPAFSVRVVLEAVRLYPKTSDGICEVQVIRFVPNPHGMLCNGFRKRPAYERRKQQPLEAIGPWRLVELKHQRSEGRGPFPTGSSPTIEEMRQAAELLQTAGSARRGWSCKELTPCEQPAM